MSRNNKKEKRIDISIPTEKAFFRFFMIFFRKIRQFVLLNWIYLIMTLPVFVILFLISGVISNHLIGEISNKSTAFMEFLIRTVTAILFLVLLGGGPAMAGASYVTRNFSRENHVYLWSDFITEVSKNFKQTTFVVLTDIPIFCVFVIAYIFYGKTPIVGNVIQYLLILVYVLFVFMHFYIYQIIVTFDMKLKNIYYNAFLFAIGRLPQNLFVLVIVILIHMGGIMIGFQSGLMMSVMILLECTFLVAFSIFFVNYNVNSAIEKYMMKKETKDDI